MVAELVFSLCPWYSVIPCVLDAANTFVKRWHYGQYKLETTNPQLPDHPPQVRISGLAFNSQHSSLKLLGVSITSLGHHAQPSLFCYGIRIQVHIISDYSMLRVSLAEQVWETLKLQTCCRFAEKRSGVRLDLDVSSLPGTPVALSTMALSNHEHRPLQDLSALAAVSTGLHMCLSVDTCIPSLF